MKTGTDQDAPIEPRPGASPGLGPEANADRWLRRTWVFFGVLTILLVGAMAYIGPGDVLRSMVIALSEDTEYAPGYSERAFQKVAIGDTEASVRGALGAPLSERTAEPYVRWLYSPDPVAGFEKNGEYPDMRHSFTTIDFGDDDAFADAFGQISHGSSSALPGASVSFTFGDSVNTLSLSDAEIETLRAEGATPAQIEAKFGRPQAVFESHAVTWLQYSRSPGGTNYRQRLIAIDGDGRVCQKDDSIWWD